MKTSIRFLFVWFVVIFCMPLSAAYADPFISTSITVGPECGHWEWQTEQVWVPGYNYQTWVPASIAVDGTPIPGYYVTMYQPGYWTIQTVQVWVSDYYGGVYGSYYGHQHGRDHDRIYDHYRQESRNYTRGDIHPSPRKEIQKQKTLIKKK